MYKAIVSGDARIAVDAAREWFENQPPAVIEERALLVDKRHLPALRPPDLASAPRLRDRVEGVRLLPRRAGAERLVEG